MVKIKKRVLALLCSALMVVTYVPAAVYADENTAAQAEPQDSADTEVIEETQEPSLSGMLPEISFRGADGVNYWITYDKITSVEPVDGKYAFSDVLAAAGVPETAYAECAYKVGGINEVWYRGAEFSNLALVQNGEDYDMTFIDTEGYTGNWYVVSSVFDITVTAKHNYVYNTDTHKFTCTNWVSGPNGYEVCNEEDSKVVMHYVGTDFEEYDIYSTVFGQITPNESGVFALSDVLTASGVSTDALADCSYEFVSSDTLYSVTLRASEYANLGIRYDNGWVSTVIGGSGDWFEVKDLGAIIGYTHSFSDETFKCVNKVDVGEGSKEDCGVEAPPTDLSLYTLNYDANAVYTGEAITPEVTVTNPEGIALTPETDYTVEYTDNINAGAGKITVKGNGRYCGSIEGAFEIAKADQYLIAEIKSHEMLIGYNTTISIIQAIGDITITTDLEGIVSIGVSKPNEIYAVEGNGAGVVNINVAAAGDDNHNPAELTLCNIKVKPQSTTIADVVNLSDGIMVTWYAAEGAQSYQLFRSEDGASMKYLKELEGNEYLDTSAVAGKEYTYKVRAISRYSSSGASAYGEFSEPSESAVRLGPTAVTYSGNTKNGLTTKWTKVDGADGYYVYRIINGTDEAMVKYIDGDGECVYNDTSAELKDGDKVRYAVIPCVYNSEGEECLGQAAYGNVRFKVNAPTITGIVQGKHAGKKAIRVNWTKAAAESDAEGTVGYYVMRSVNGGSYTKVATVSTRGYYDYDVTSGNTYRYKVYAYKTNGKITARSIISNASDKIVKK